MSDDVSLADEPTPDIDEAVDVSPGVDAEDFDFEAFLSGVRPTRRAIKVYARADLVAKMEEAAGGLRDDMPAQAKKQVLKEVTRLREEFEASGVWFIAEARSQEWVNQFREDAAKKVGDTGPEDAKSDELTPAQIQARTKITLMQTAAQVVSPTNVTAEGLERLGNLAPTELNKIIAAVTVANVQSAGSAQVLTRDFSQGHSGKNVQRRGSSSRN